MPNTNVEQQLAAAAKVIRLRQELAQAEAELTGTATSKPRQRSARGDGPSVSERVLHLITEAGATGIARRDILAVIKDADGAVHSALKAHSSSGRIYSRNGMWVLDPRRTTREMRAPAVPVGLDQEVR